MTCNMQIGCGIGEIAENGSPAAYAAVYETLSHCCDLRLHGISSCFQLYGNLIFRFIEGDIIGVCWGMKNGYKEWPKVGLFV